MQPINLSIRSTFSIVIGKRCLIVLFQFILGICALAPANGQPNVQKASIRSPIDIKIDGKLSEWDEKLQARNGIDGIKYTISNDDDNLYLTLVAPNKETCRKALRAGITFTVSKLIDKRRKTDKAKKTVTYPIRTNTQGFEMAAKLDEYSTYIGKKNTSQSKSDSLLLSVNKKAAAIYSKFEVDGKVAPINFQNIQACSLFTRDLDLVYELCIPLKFLAIDINYSAPFSYNICLNGFREDRKIDYSIPAPIPPPGYTPPPPDSRYLPTDFWGEYVLAKR